MAAAAAAAEFAASVFSASFIPISPADLLQNIALTTHQFLLTRGDVYGSVNSIKVAKSATSKLCIVAQCAVCAQFLPLDGMVR